MSRYFFDIHSQGKLFRDSEGHECDGHEEVRKEAMHALPAIAKDAIPKDGDRQAFTVLVRDDKNVTVFIATLTFAGVWMGDVPIPERTATD